MRLRRWLTFGALVTAGSWAVYAGIAWACYGHPKRLPGDAEAADPLLDSFMPDYEVVEHHSTRVAAPAGTTFAAASSLDLTKSLAVRALFRGRELLLGSHPQKTVLPATLFDWAQALGWVLLAQAPGREAVFGAATKPWEADVRFRAIPPGQFSDFRDPGYVKIAWTVRADPAAHNHSIARTETRVTTTDPAARARFRLYWAILSPGMRIIRLVALRMVKRAAERQKTGLS
jgi:hypothetical protein